MPDADDLQNVGDQPRHDRLPPPAVLIRSAVAEVRYNRGDTPSPGATAGVRESQKLDQMIACRWRGRLHEKDLFPAHAFEQLYRDVAVRIPIDHAAAEPSTKLAGDGFRQRWIGGAREDLELTNHGCSHLSPRLGGRIVVLAIKRIEGALRDLKQCAS
ncbi:MAG: hypothetical protein QOK01_1039 [Alphaproteobacteria bacterium]|nr:hypothetical protein [Alphaproteobacteria bacterium]